MSAQALCDCGAPATANGRECGRCYRTRVGSLGRIADPAHTRRWYNRLEGYRAVRAEGSQPRGTKTVDIEEAKRVSDATGRAFDPRAVRA